MVLRLPSAAVRAGLPTLRRLVYNADLDPVRQRSRERLVLGPLTRTPRGTTTEQIAVGGVPCLRVLAPGADPARVVVHLHGGAYIAGWPAMAAPYAARLGAAAGCAVLLPDYRLAPEHPWPAAVDDAHAVWTALTSDGAVGAPAPVLAGDSAGAGAAVALALRLRDGAGLAPAALGLVCPFLDLVVERRTLSEDPLLSAAWLAQGAAAYAGDADPAGPELSPLRADLSGLPPAHVVSAAHDTLVPDAYAFTQAVGLAGGTVQHDAEQTLWHDFPLLAGTIVAADRAADRFGAFVRRSWA